MRSIGLTILLFVLISSLFRISGANLTNNVTWLSLGICAVLIFTNFKDNKNFVSAFWERFRKKENKSDKLEVGSDQK